MGIMDEVHKFEDFVTGHREPAESDPAPQDVAGEPAPESTEEPAPQDGVSTPEPPAEEPAPTAA